MSRDDRQSSAVLMAVAVSLLLQCHVSFNSSTVNNSYCTMSLITIIPLGHKLMHDVIWICMTLYSGTMSLQERLHVRHDIVWHHIGDLHGPRWVVPPHARPAAPVCNAPAAPGKLIITALCPGGISTCAARAPAALGLHQHW